MSNVVFFDGVDDYVDCGVGASFNITDNLTQEILIKHNIVPFQGVSGQYAVISQKGGALNAGGAFGFYYHIGNLQVYAYYRDSTNTLVGGVATPGVDAKKWHHLVSTFATGTMKIYLNGNLISTGPAGFNTLNVSAQQYVVSYVKNTWYAGLVANARVYNRVLSDDEVLYNWMHPNNPKRRGLVLNLTQDSIYGPTWLDLSGNANNGTYVGGAVPVTANRLAGR